MTTRVVFLTNIVSPYRKPVFERLASIPGWDFRVIVNALNEFDRGWDVDLDELDVTESRTWSIRRKVVSRQPVRFEQVITLHMPVGLLADLRRIRPDVIISHELGPRSIVAAMYAALHRVPLILWSYQSRVSATQGQRTRSSVRRALLQQARVVVGMGVQARAVLRGLGVPGSKIIDAPNAADHQTIKARQEAPEARRRVAAIRARVAPDRRIALVPGRLVPLKGTAAPARRMARRRRANPRLVASGLRR